MRKHVLSFVLCSIAFSGLAQDKVGIGSKTPTSTLTVEGSIAGGYREITTFNTPVKLEETDHYVTFNANGNGQIILPAVGMGDSSLKGRIYKIKNISNYTVTITPALDEKFRNFGQDTQNIELKPGQYAEIVCNGKMLGTSTWDVSSISLGIPEEPPVIQLPENEPIWQFINIYDYAAIDSQLVTVSGTELIGFSKTIVVPANKEAKIVVSYSIPLGSISIQYGYYGVSLRKNNRELEAGSRRGTTGNSASTAAMVMTSISAAIADNITASPSDQRITYSLHSYLDGVRELKYGMYSATGENYNWGRGYWSIMVYLK
ncbi:hypothetical protein [Myroides odoratus]|uniref:IgGFc-binding protein N-terminal domain-containing protein n=1 Tax=Myroides odoratus TaxID=256 RepID=A0A378RL49_MYROD|nr:hypothetical protein [Myroides odoratus]QQU04822.1 hypothetical protein I6I89_05910 [Myroides odoratus]STZ27725.1 Uncharacterised protein [Myroides odoratus]